MADYIRINPADNVAVALRPLARGTVVGDLVLQEDIPQGHKFTLCDLAEGDNVIKYGYPIGHLTRPAVAGTLIDHSCIKTNLEGLLDYKYEPEEVLPSETVSLPLDPTSPRSCEVPPLTMPRVARVSRGDTSSARSVFMGYRRADGQVGVRNQIWIIPTVGCVNGVCQELAKRFGEEIAGQAGNDGKAAGIDVIAFPHNYGCSQLGPDHENTRVILADMVHHPNAGGVLVVGLGCENNQMSAFRELVGKVDGNRVKFFETQKVEGDEIEYGMERLREIYAACKDDAREPVPVSELRVGLKCGGSDGLSGITANPLL
ncbi:MAG: UxaA family hydrolase, partial [Bacteroidales bacterium]|nr:UxaA family hydrolase [Bacteroidales bacterium]